VFENPEYKHFEPSIETMLAEPVTSDQSVELDSGTLFRTEEDKGEYITKKKITLEEIEGWLLKAWPSTGAADKLAKTDVVDKVFSTRSWLAVEQKSLDALLKGLEEIKALVMAELEKQFPDIVEKEKKAKVGKEATK
jgi:hypothetical protein